MNSSEPTTTGEENESRGRVRPDSTSRTMRAVVRPTYGASGVLEVVDIEVPTPGDREVLVEVAAAALNPLDLHLMTGTPWVTRLGAGLREPKSPAFGHDLAGRVAAVGHEVDGFEVGDEVVGVAPGSVAEFVVVPAGRLVHKPAGVAFTDAMGMGVAALTALQGLRDKGELRSGQRVLINGASGGVGVAAVQIAVWMGADVTAVCSSRNVDLVASLGAREVIDYTTGDFTEVGEHFDVILDNHANQPLSRIRGILALRGVYVMVGGPKSNRVVGPLGRMVTTLVRFAPSRQRAKAFIAQVRRDDLVLLAELMAGGDLRAVIDGEYTLDDVPAAMERLAEGHVRGKLVVCP